MPLPPPPVDEIVLFARALAGCIRRGMSGNGFACLLRMRLGMAYVRFGATKTPAEVLEQFRIRPEAWKALQPVIEKFEPFWADVQRSFQTMVAVADKEKRT